MAVDALRRAIAASPTALMLLAPSGRVVEANEATAALVGTSREDLVDGPVFNLATEDKQEKAPFRLRMLFQSGLQSVSWQLDFKRRDGRPGHLAAWALVVTTEGGPLALIGAAGEGPVDPTRMSRPGRVEFPALLSTDHDWRLVRANADAESLLGTERAELLGQPLLGMISPQDAGTAIVALAGVKDGAVSVNLRLNLGNHRQDVRMMASGLCDHKPPRLLCLLLPSVPTPCAAGPTTAPAPAGRANRGPGWNGLAGGNGTADGHGTAGGNGKAGGHGMRLVARNHGLTAQQWDLVKLLVQGQTISQLSKSLYLSEGTVRNRLSEIYHRFGVHSQAGLLSALFSEEELSSSRERW